VNFVEIMGEGGLRHKCDYCMQDFVWVIRLDLVLVASKCSVKTLSQI